VGEGARHRRRRRAVILHAGEIAAVIVFWAAGLTGILLATAPEGERTLGWSSIRPRRQLRPHGSFADVSRGVPGADGDIVDSRAIRDAPTQPLPLPQLGGVVGMESEPPGESGSQPAIDPLAQQAATLLAKAMVTSDNRELLWQRFHERVEATAAELEEAPVREAIEEIQRRGLSLDLVARVVQKRLSE
jgi:hypothetical protein